MAISGPRNSSLTADGSPAPGRTQTTVPPAARKASASKLMFGTMPWA
jgi:hypothetical protein